LSDDQRKIGPFRLLRPLGESISTPVWLGEETFGTTHGRTAAIKLFALNGPSDPHRERIALEAHAPDHPPHPDAARFIALHVNERYNVAGLVMEHVQGTPLSARLRPDGVPRSLPWKEALAVGLDVASALVSVHQAQLIHRDVKPA